MKVAIISRVFNEENLIVDFLNHYNDLATGGFYFYDDGSTDRTLSILKAHANVKDVVKGERISTASAHKNQNQQRQQIINIARKDLGPDDYFLLLDVDEFIEFDSADPMQALMSKPEHVFALFDMYITQEDRDDPWQNRKKFGPEVRYIIMAVKNSEYITLQNDRTIITSRPKPQQFTGYVKHVGKAVSIEYWERKCNHYTSPGIPNKYYLKWDKRKGKSIHSKSDFGRELYDWDVLKQNKSIWVEIQ